MKNVLDGLKKASSLTVVLLVICGLIYPLALTGISKVIFREKANGSLIMVDNVAVGSSVVGQKFTDSRFMKCRPSAVNYNTYTKEEKEDGTYTGVSSGSKNYAPTHPDLVKRVEEDMETFLKAHPNVKKEDIPTDLLTASGSGLDPHISPQSAAIQIPALVEATGLSEERLNAIVESNTNKKVLGVFGEDTVNVLKVNVEIAKELNIIKE